MGTASRLPRPSAQTARLTWERRRAMLWSTCSRKYLVPASKEKKKRVMLQVVQSCERRLHAVLIGTASDEGCCSFQPAFVFCFKAELAMSICLIDILYRIFGDVYLISSLCAVVTIISLVRVTIVENAMGFQSGSFWDRAPVHLSLSKGRKNNQMEELI